MTNTIRELLKRPIAYHPIIAKAFDSVTLAVLWCQFYYWSERTNDPDGWIYKTREDIFNETGLSRKQQETARKIGAKLGVMEDERRGEKGIVHFRIDVDNAINLIEKYLEKNPSASPTRIAKKETTVKTEQAIDLPAWMDRSVWQEWETYRKQKRQALTPISRAKQIKFLEPLKADHVEIINQSMRNGWTGLFPLKTKKATTNDYRPRIDSLPLEKKQTPEEMAKSREILSSMKEKFVIKTIPK
jgi:hypothetical protein